MPRIRLAESDWPKYERGDEWFTLELIPESLTKLPADIVEEFEETTNQGLITFYRRLSQERLSSARQALWLARRLGGVIEPYDQFHPDVMGADAEELPAETKFREKAERDKARGNGVAAPANRAARRATRTKKPASAS